MFDSRIPKLEYSDDTLKYKGLYQFLKWNSLNSLICDVGSDYDGSSQNISSIK